MSRAVKSMSKMWLRARLSATGLLSDRSGIAATEFAVIVPIMLVMFFSTIVFSIGVAIDRKVTLMARAVADLTSQAATVDDPKLAVYFGAAGKIMQPYVPPTYIAPNSTISELYIDPVSGAARVQWSRTSNGAGIAAGRAISSTVAIPPSLIALDANGKIIPNQYLIFGEVNLLYTPTLPFVTAMAPAGVTLSDVAYTRPRQSTCVFYPAAPAGNNPPCPTL
jgi:Flp pilus assembly protein TadG